VVSFDIKPLGEIFKNKTTSFLFLGILLMIFSMYFNYLKEGSGNIGINISDIIILFSLFAQLSSWIVNFIVPKV
jgi:hypothetical protein